MLIADLLNKEGSLFVSKNWFYATELIILNIQMVYKYALKIFSDWNTARTVSLAILLLILLLSYFYLAKQAKLKNLGVWVAIMFLLPLSDLYAFIVLIGNCYIPYIAISFFSLGLLLKLYNEGTLKKASSIVSIVLLLILAFVTGLAGIRQLIVFYIPVSITFLYFSYLDVTKNSATSHGFDFLKRFINIITVVILAVFIFNVVGFFVNAKILASSYTFGNFNAKPIVNFQLSRMIDYFCETTIVLGYQPGNSVFSIRGIQSIVAVIFFIVIFVVLGISLKKLKCFSFNKQVIIVFTFVLLLSTLLIHSLISKTATNYLIPTAMCGFITLVIYFQDIDYQSLFARLIPVGLLAVLLFSYYISPNINVVFSDSKGKLNRAVEWLIDNDYKNGYATYWNGNISTELSDGELEMWVINEIGHNKGGDDLVLYGWMQKKEHLSVSPEGTVFVLLSEDEYTQAPKYAREENIVYNENGYYIFGYKSADDLYATLDES